MRVVIIPRAGLGRIYDDNRSWAQQFAGAGPQERAVVEIAQETPQAVLQATRDAARRAGREGQLIYAVGHGGAGAASFAGTADLGPRGSFRVTSYVAFHQANTAHTGVLSAETLLDELGEIDRLQRSARPQAGTDWCARQGVPGRADCRQFRLELADAPGLQPHYDDLCDILHASRVRQVVLLTCNVGAARWFVDELATDLEVPVKAYTRRVVSTREPPSGTIRMYLEGDAVGSGTNTDACRTELVPNASPADVYVGQIVPKRAPGTRRSRLPPLIE